jgi:hypothetical protein
MKRRALATGLAATLALALGLRPEEPARAAPPPDVGAALRWLVAQQGDDGSWGHENKLAITGMAGLALLAAGSTPTRGPYSDNVYRAVQFVLACQGEGRAYQHTSSGYSAIHNHGYALLFLTQAYGESGSLDARIKSSIERGVKATIDSQCENGGFSYFLYNKQPAEHRDMWSWDEASTTISQVQALRGARDAGFKIASRPLEKAAAYVARSQHATGGFYYSIGSAPKRVSFVEGDNRPSFAVSAAATAVLHALGTYDGPVVDRGLAYIEPFQPPVQKKVPFFFYGHYYAAQVMHMLGGPRGIAWMNAIRADLAKRQNADGSWPDDPEDSLPTGDSQVLDTAWALQICLIDDGMLPLHER